jgi:hypothetical protein
MEWPAVSLVLLGRLASAWRGGPSVRPRSWPWLAASNLAPRAWGIGFGDGPAGCRGLVRPASVDGRVWTVDRRGSEADDHRGQPADGMSRCPARARADRAVGGRARLAGRRVAALSDVHGHLPALEAVLAEVGLETADDDERWRSSGPETDTEQTADHPGQAHRTGQLTTATGRSSPGQRNAKIADMRKTAGQRPNSRWRY